MAASTPPKDEAPEVPEPVRTHVTSVPIEPYVVEVSDPVHRIYSGPGSPNGHGTSWDQWRTFGPLWTARFDYWPPGAAVEQTTSVTYVAADVTTCVAECWQGEGAIDLTEPAGRRLVTWTPTRPLRLLDLTSRYAYQVGATALISRGGPKSRTRQWAHLLWTLYGDTVDGLLYEASDGTPAIVLWERARDAVPALPDLDADIGDPVVVAEIFKAGGALARSVIDPEGDAVLIEMETLAVPGPPRVRHMETQTFADEVLRRRGES